MRCSVCSLPQYGTPSGITCANGHGGVPGIPTEPSKAAKGNSTEVGMNLRGFQVQRLTLEHPVAVMAGEELSIEPVSETEAIVTIYNPAMHVAVNTRMKIKMEKQV